MIVLASASYATISGLFGASLGLALHMSWHILDGADGDLARLTNRASPKGEIVDGICDYFGHFVLYLVLGFILAQQWGNWIWSLTILAGASRIIQANHYETQRRQYLFWTDGTPWLRSEESDHRKPSGVFGAIGSSYLALSHWLSPGAQEVDEAIGKVVKEQKSQTSKVVRDEMASAVKRLWPLSANYRTLVLGGSMMVGMPALFVLFEALILNILLALSLRRAKRATVQILGRI